MMGLRYVAIALAFGVITVASTAAAPLAESGDSIEWQRIELESRVTEKTVRALSAILPEGKYFVDVSIHLTQVAGSPKRSVSPEKTRPDQKTRDAWGRLPLGKLNIDVTPPKAMDPPVLTDLFSVIRSASVNIFLDQSVPDSRKELIEQLVQSVTDPIVGEGKADIQIEKIAFALPNKEAQGSWNRWYEELKLPLLSLLLMGLFCGMSAWIFVSYRQIELRKLALLEAQLGSPRLMSSPENAEGRPLQSLTAGASLPSPADTRTGITAFRELLREDPKRACLLIRQWLRVPGLGASAALSLIPFAVPADELNRLFGQLTQEERRLWMQALRIKISTESAVAADTYLGAQVVEAMLSPEPLVSAELLERLAALYPEDCVDILTEDPDAGALVVSVLPSGHVARIYELLPSDVAERVTQATLNVSAENTKQYADALEAILARRSAHPAPGPFLDKAIELLKVVGPEKERAIFDLLAESGQLNLLAKVARQHFPAELIAKLPPIAIRAALLSLEPGLRAEILFSRSAESREELLSALGDATSKSRALAVAELVRVEADPAKQAYCARNRESLWTEFVHAVRRTLQSPGELSAAAEDLIEAWLFAKTGGRAGRARGAEPQTRVA